MASRRLRRSNYPRRKRARGFLWTLLGLLTLGVVTTILASRRSDLLEALETEPDRPRRPEPEPEPAASEPAAMPGETVWIAGPAGNLYVRDGGEGHPDALPVVFLHSLAGNSGQWTLQLDHLRRQRRAVALDLRGHGESDPADDGDYSIPAFASDVAAVADQIELRRFLLAGHSLGAAVALEYASRHPERVAGLLLVDPNGDQSRVPAREVQPFLDALRSDPLSEIESYFRQLVVGGDPEASRWVLEDIRLTHEDAVVGGLEGSIEYKPLPALDRYKGPKLSIISDMNRLPYSLHNLVPELPVQLMAGAGHWLMLDRPAAFNQLLDEFVDVVEREG